jgi:hypothetical protein
MKTPENKLRVNKAWYERNKETILEKAKARRRGEFRKAIYDAERKQARLDRIRRQEREGKVCSRCREHKVITEFSPLMRGEIVDYHNWCKPCRVEMQLIYNKRKAAA